MGQPAAMFGNIRMGYRFVLVNFRNCVRMFRFTDNHQQMDVVRHYLPGGHCHIRMQFHDSIHTFMRIFPDYGVMHLLASDPPKIWHPVFCTKGYKKTAAIVIVPFRPGRWDAVFVFEFVVGIPNAHGLMIMNLQKISQ